MRHIPSRLSERRVRGPDRVRHRVMTAQHHDLYTDGRPRGLERDNRGINRECASVRRKQRDARILRHMEECLRRRAVGIRTGQAAALGLGNKARQLKPSRFAVFKYNHKLSLIIARQQHETRMLIRVHLELAREIVAERARLGVVKVAGAHLVALLLVGQDQNLGCVRRIKRLEQAVALLELVIRARAVGLFRVSLIFIFSKNVFGLSP